MDILIVQDPSVRFLRNKWNLIEYLIHSIHRCFAQHSYFIQIVHMSEFYARKHNPLLENRLFRFGGE